MGYPTALQLSMPSNPPPPRSKLRAAYTGLVSAATWHATLQKRINQYLTNRRRHKFFFGGLSIMAQQVVETLFKFPKVESEVAASEMLLLDYPLDDPLCIVFATRRWLRNVVKQAKEAKSCGLPR